VASTELQAFIDNIRAMGSFELDVATMRKMTSRAPAYPKPVDITWESVDAAGVPAEWITPDDAVPGRAIVYFHGGGYATGTLDSARALFCHLARATRARLLAVDYRLAPEHPFPAAIEDACAAYRGLLAEGLAASSLAIAGDSAGGNLSLVTLMRARDAGLPLPDCGVLLSPATDLTLTGPSLQYNAEADVMFSTAAGDMLPDLYCPGQLRTNPLVSPLFGNWTGLPPLLFHAGSTEMLLDDSVRAHDRARQAGTTADITVYRDLPHVFQVMRWLPEARIANQAVAEFILRCAAEHVPMQALPLETPGVAAELAFDRVGAAAL
jgi:acetyl esterase/lipase